MKLIAALLAVAAATTTPAPHKKPVPNIPPTAKLPHVLYALRYIDLKAGTGPLAQPHQFYTVNYTGWLTNGTKFDSSYDHTPAGGFTFQQGGRVIPGWNTGFDGMHVGGKRRLLIPYQLAYGERAMGEPGKPPVIPSNSNLIFDIELLGASDTPPAPPAPAPAPQPEVPAAQPTNPATPPASTSTPPANEARPPHPEAP